ncbi:uncharacterized protein N7518_009226 [Penicillium psychrosexuale]|uniref:uncharacterized protein n=1 Tax=Penicillium psychrosexuale TaxID=1002107 RepID=UPI0025458507|nr:uncharacterized protein N7518_009226 [Penicillium psychrosexuale]KAJ5783549.1 hypothetical protein N7518_009226 [Penicillium psychrosexuale]
MTSMSNTIQEETAILFQDKNIYLIDIPHSIALAQEGRPTSQQPTSSSSGAEKSTHKNILNLLSCSPIKEPFSSTEPKKPAALANLLNTIPISERRFHSELILPLVRDSLETIQARFPHDRRWCEARVVPRESLNYDSRTPAQKRRRGNDYICLESADDGVSTQNEPPMILSTTSPNDFEALSDLAIVKNPSPEPAIVRVGSCHRDEANSPPCEYMVPPKSSFVLCTLPLFQMETDRPSTSNNYPIPGLPPHHQKFNLILMDPPWPNKSVRRSGHYQTHHYSEMDVLTEGLRDILRMHSHDPNTKQGLRQETHTEPIQSEQSIAAIWITNAEKARRAAYEALTGAGFCICEEWIWVKTTWDGQPISALEGLWRKPYEILVIGRKGDHSVNVSVNAKVNNATPLSQIDDLTRMSETITTRRVIAAVPDLHSRKPNLKSIFEKVFFTDAGRCQEYSALEVFARNLTAGWWAAGNEVLRFNARECWVELGDREYRHA